MSSVRVIGSEMCLPIPSCCHNCLFFRDEEGAFCMLAECLDYSHPVVRWDWEKFSTERAENCPITEKM